jgi:hypothetical protein
MHPIEQNVKVLHRLAVNQIGYRQVEGSLGIFGIACQRLGQITRQLQMLFMYPLQLALPHTVGETHTNGPSREGGEEEKEDG